MTRRVALLLVAVCGVLPFAVPVAAHAAPAAPAATCQADGNHVALVVDFGDHVDAQCIPVSPKETGYEVLGDRARVNGSGLVCAIDGVPATGCGEQTGDGHYAYWSYWHGTAANGWTYSNVSPSTRVSASIAEGWRWTPNGSANPNDPKPNWSADPAVTCIASTTTTVAPSTVPEEAPAAPTISSTTRTTVASSDSPSTTTTVPATTAPTASTSSSSSSQAALSRVNETGRGSGSPVGVLVGGGLVVALGGGAFALSRRRSASGP